MIRVIQQGEEGLYEVSIHELEFEKYKWIDVSNPTEEELKILTETISINLQDVERCLDEQERPCVEDLDKFTLLIFKSPLRNPKSVTTTSISFLISDKLLVTFRSHDAEGIQKISTLDKEKMKVLFQKGMSYVTYQILEKIMDDYFSILDFIQERISKLENQVFTDPAPDIVKEIFALRKTLIYFHKSLSANRDVMGKLREELSNHVDEKNIKLFRYVSDDIVQLIDVVATYRDILTGALEIYLSSISNNMNIVMKKMAAFASLILVPTLIAGVYGMNFIHMPELYWTHGYYFAIGLMLVSVLLLTIYFKKNDWF